MLKKMQLILLSEPVWIKICRKIYEISRKVLIAGVIGYDSKRGILSCVSGKRKKKYHPNGCVDRYKDTFKRMVREKPEE